MEISVYTTKMCFLWRWWFPPHPYSFHVYSDHKDKQGNPIYKLRLCKPGKKNLVMDDCNVSSSVIHKH